MGIFSSIASGLSRGLSSVGRFLSGGGSSAIQPANVVRNVPGLVNTPALLSNAARTMIPADDWLRSFGRTATSALGNLVDEVVVTAPRTVSNAISPANILRNVPGLIDTPALLNAASSLINGGSSPTVEQPGGPNTVDEVVVEAPSQPQPQPVEPMDIVTDVPGLQQPPQGPGGGTPSIPQLPGGGSQPGGGSSQVNTVNGGGMNIGTLLAAMPALASFFKKDDLGPGADALNKMALDMAGKSGRLMETATANQNGMINGVATSAIERRLSRQEAQIRQNYAAMGMSGSTMEAQDLNEARMNAQSEIFDTGVKMATQGFNTATAMLNMQSDIYQSLMQAQLDQDKAFSEAMAEFAAAAIRDGGTTQVNVNGGGGQTSTSSGGLTIPPEVKTILDLGMDVLPADIIKNVPGLTTMPNFSDVATG